MNLETQKLRNLETTRSGFTLIEMLVVIGIISILIGASLAGFGKMVKSADRAKAQELVSQTATALTAIYEADGMWPAMIRKANAEASLGVVGNESGNEIARILAKRGYMSMSMKDGKLVGRDRFGILTPWAAKVVERQKDVTLDTKVNGNSTIRDNVLHFAVDLNGDGEITAEECGNRTEAEVIRATVAVWCIDKDGKGRIQSWTKGQAQKVK